MSKDEKLFDVRVSERYIIEGQLTKKEYDSFIKNLPDVEKKSEVLIVEEPEDEAAVEESPEEEQAEEQEGNEDE